MMLAFSSINGCITESDALDRTISIDQDRIRPGNRKEEAEIIAEFDKLRPKLLGYILISSLRSYKLKMM